MTRIYFAAGASPKTWHTTFGGFDLDARGLGVLVSFATLPLRVSHLDPMDPQPTYTMLDSGAFSAWTRGHVVDIDALVEESRQPRWKEAVALDVIGDADASVANALAMKAKGSPAFPVFHYGDPWEHLELYKREFGKVGLSCLFGEAKRDSFRWLGQCFARAWPYKFHSFGWTEERMLMQYPFHSADSSSRARPQTWGTFRGLTRGVQKLPVRRLYNLRSEAEHFSRLAERLRTRWASEMRQIEAA